MKFASTDRIRAAIHSSRAVAAWGVAGRCKRDLVLGNQLRGRRRAAPRETDAPLSDRASNTPPAGRYTRTFAAGRRRAVGLESHRAFSCRRWEELRGSASRAAAHLVRVGVAHHLRGDVPPNSRQGVPVVFAPVALPVSSERQNLPPSLVSLKPAAGRCEAGRNRHTKGAAACAGRARLDALAQGTVVAGASSS